MDRRFVCRDCGTKWFLHEHRTEEPDLERCERCGGALEQFEDPPPLPFAPDNGPDHE